jgi:hypothetical protein
MKLENAQKRGATSANASQFIEVIVPHLCLYSSPLDIGFSFSAACNTEPLKKLPLGEFFGRQSKQILADSTLVGYYEGTVNIITMNAPNNQTPVTDLIETTRLEIDAIYRSTLQKIDELSSENYDS